MLINLSTNYQFASFAISLKFYSFIIMFIVSIHAVLLPTFSKKENQNYTIQKNMLNKWIKFSSIIIIFFILFAVFGKKLFFLIISGEYPDAFPSFVILSCVLYLHFLFYPLISLIITNRNFNFLISLTILRFIIVISSNLYFIPKIGCFGAGLTILIDYSILYIFLLYNFYFSKRKLING